MIRTSTRLALALAHLARSPRRVRPGRRCRAQPRGTRLHARQPADLAAGAVHEIAFRVTHRFTRPLGDECEDNLLEDLFGLDSGARHRPRVPVRPGAGRQIGVHRSSLDKTIEFFGEYALLRQPSGVPVDDRGARRRSTAPTTSATATRRRSARSCRGASAIVAAVYIEPIWVEQRQPAADRGRRRRLDLLLGMGARVRIRRRSIWSASSRRGSPATTPGHDHRQLRHREARRRAYLPAELLELVRDDDGQIARGGADEDPGIWASTSRGSSSDGCRAGAV